MTGTLPLALRSFKVQLVEGRVRIVPKLGLDGCAFTGPGVDLVGDEARALFSLAAPLLSWLSAREPGIGLRSLSIDLERGLILLTYLPAEAPPVSKPLVLRVEGTNARELCALARPLEAALAERALVKLRARADRERPLRPQER